MAWGTGGAILRGIYLPLYRGYATSTLPKNPKKCKPAVSVPRVISAPRRRPRHSSRFRERIGIAIMKSLRLAPLALSLTLVLVLVAPTSGGLRAQGVPSPEAHLGY